MYKCIIIYIYLPAMIRPIHPFDPASASQRTSFAKKKYKYKCIYIN